MKRPYYCVCVVSDTLEVVGVYDYKPEVPETIKICKILKTDYQNLMAGTHKFDASSETCIEVKPEIDELKRQKYKNYLIDSDWIVMRHMREKFLGLPTTLSDSEFLAFETKRQNISKLI